MNKQITLSKTDEILLLDVLEYITDFDEREKEDFTEHHGDFLNEYGVLKLEEVPHEARTHIYYKAEFLRQELLGAKES